MTRVTPCVPPSLSLNIPTFSPSNQYNFYNYYPSSYYYSYPNRRTNGYRSNYKVSATRNKAPSNARISNWRGRNMTTNIQNPAELMNFQNLYNP